MKTLVLLSLSFAVALGMPPPPPGVPQSPVLPKEEQSPLLGDSVPAQGHVEVENPGPQARLSSTEVLEVQPEVKVELKAGPEVKGEEVGIEVVKSVDKVEEKSEAGQEVHVEPEVQVEPEAEPDFRVESDVQMEPPLSDKAQEQMNLDRQTDPLLSVQERHIDMEGKYETQGGEFEPLDDSMMLDNTELSEVEKSMRAAFQNPDLAVEPQPEVEEEKGPDGSVMEEAGGEFMGKEDRPVFDEQIEGAGRRFLPNLERQGLSYCPGVVFEGKCYEFFREPKRFADAEFFCQEHFIGGHLASITSPRIHRDVMDLMLKKIGTYTRTWVGGLRFLDTERFVWLDGSFWDYSDWLNGEPNNTANVEECLELLAFGNGKFNDFTCWEPQAFICSYPYE